MELRSYNVEQVYFDCTKCRIKDELGVNKEVLEQNFENIKSMCEQLPKEAPMNEMHIRNDGEVWTPYLQLVEMLILLGRRIGVIKFEGELKSETIIRYEE